MRAPAGATELRLIGYHEAAVALLDSAAAQAAYEGRPFTDDQQWHVNHFHMLVDLVQAAQHRGVDPWPYVREWALACCRESARALDEAVERALLEVKPIVKISPDAP